MVYQTIRPPPPGDSARRSLQKGGFVKIPGSIKVGGRNYEIICPYIFRDSQSVLYGLHDPSGQTIKISTKDEHGCDRHPESITHTFLHEILHAIDSVYFGGKLTVWEHGEDAIDQLAEGLLYIFNDNDLDLGNDNRRQDQGID